jgi:hypothetical protein
MAIRRPRFCIIPNQSPLKSSAIWGVILGHIRNDIFEFTSALRALDSTATCVTSEPPLGGNCKSKVQAVATAAPVSSCGAATSSRAPSKHHRASGESGELGRRTPTRGTAAAESHETVKVGAAEAIWGLRICLYGVRLGADTRCAQQASELARARFKNTTVSSFQTTDTVLPMLPASAGATAA